MNQRIPKTNSPDTEWPGEEHWKAWEKIGCVGEYVYFVQAGDQPEIKIGYTTDVGRRLASLQTGNGKRLRLLVLLPGSQRLEVAYHRLLAQDRTVGEWFEGVVVREALEDAKDASITMMRIWNEKLWVPNPFDHLVMVKEPENYDAASHRRDHLAEFFAETRFRSSEGQRRQQKVTGNYVGKGLRRGSRVKPLEDAPVSSSFVDPATMDRTPSRIRSTPPKPPAPRDDAPWRGKRPDWLDEAA